MKNKIKIITIFFSILIWESYCYYSRSILENMWQESFFPRMTIASHGYPATFTRSEIMGKFNCKKCGRPIKGTGKTGLCKSCLSKMRVFSDETRQKIRLSKLGDRNPMKNPEVSKKVADKLRNRKVPKEVCKKISKNSAKYWKDKKIPEEAIKKRSLTVKGKKYYLKHKKDCNCYVCRAMRGEYKGKTLSELGHKPNCKCFCCRAQRGEYKGENHPSFIHGKAHEPYCKEWNKKLKKKIHIRDNYVCQKCGLSNDDSKKIYKRVLVVHHIDYNKKNCKENNLVTVCVKCNSEVNFNRAYWQEYFKNLLKSRGINL